jgi:transcriptional regulator with XRE-family HTH domain
MPLSYMAPAYIVPSDFSAMKLTPGEFLAAELDRLGMTRADLAKTIGVEWPTINRWVKNDGFTRKNRVAAAAALGLQPDHFEVPPATILHQLKCEEECRKFLASPLAPPDITDEEKAALASQQIPLDRDPTEHFYAGLLYLLRGRLLPSRFEAEVAENEALARRRDAKIESIQKDAAKKDQASLKAKSKQRSKRQPSPR